ncbi:MAG TPA: HEAT repeat domain-containing protein [Bryobacteraceae bacterium]|nr:HEAT repeat domain-containing protein [Bryobacteraceae bacterium]
MYRIHIVLLALALAGCQKVKTEKSRFETPAGFSVEVVAKPEQTGSLINLTFDSLGRPVVSKEKEHPTTLIDRDGDGYFETEKVFSDKVTHAQGMWFEGRTLYATAHDVAEKQAGLYRMEDTDGDDVADTFERVSTFQRTMGEHGPHAIRRAPDGEMEIMLGNHTFPPADKINALSPLRNYHEGNLLERYWDARGHAKGILAPGGVLTRWNKEAKDFTLIFGGMRNAYDFAYNRDGERFTFDSDMEWDINLPWYRPVRSLHGIPGGDYGWRSGSENMPNDFSDTLPPFHEAGRGSPVGIEFYHHNAYPQGYFDAFLEADWSRGRILISYPKRAGATYRLQSGAVEFVHGEPLNVTDLEVGPDGSVYFTLGGRGTAGGLYRIAYKPGFWDKLFRKGPEKGILRATRQPQPLSSWGHAALQQLKQSMGETWAKDLEELARNPRASTDDRVQAALVLQRLGPKPSGELLRHLAEDRDPSVRAVAVYLAGGADTEPHKAIAAGGLKDADPFVRRRAAEALVRQNWAPVEALLPLFEERDQFVRYAARVALERAPRENWQDGALKFESPEGRIEGFLALSRTAKSSTDLDPVLRNEIAMLKSKTLRRGDELRLLRAIQVTAIGHSDGLPETARKEIHSILLPRFPSPDRRLQMEYARMLAYCGQPEAIGKLLASLRDDEEDQQMQIHLVYCLRTMKNGWTKEQKQKLINWFPKASKWRGGASFTGFINFMFDSSLAFLDPDEVKAAYQRVPEFAPLKEGEKGVDGRPSVVARQKGVQAYSPQEIYEFQMFDPMTLQAKPEEGKKIFEEQCASCHRHGSLGKDFGPDLTTLTSRFQKKDILEAILWPSKTVSDQYQSWIVETKDGDTMNGLLVSEDDRKMVLKTGDQERPIELGKANVKSKRLSKVSIMPENAMDGYGMAEVSNLMAFLLGGGK